MEWRDWIALAQVVAMVGVGTWFALRLEKLRKLYARNLKRYDLLHTARFKAMEVADDSLVDVQLAEFNAWLQLHDRGRDPNERRREDDRVIEDLRKAGRSVAQAKVKCEKYFDQGFNDRFAALMGKIQHSEMCLRDVRDLPSYVNAAQLEPENVRAMNAACIVTRDAIPAFRRSMSETIQKDLEE